MSEKLLPCPFCGSDEVRLIGPTCRKNDPPKPYEGEDAFPKASCSKCHAGAWGDDWDNSKKSAIKAWNTRTPIDAGGDDSELAASVRDMVRTGTGIMKDGVRVAPKDFFKSPSNTVTINRGKAERLSTLLSLLNVDTYSDYMQDLIDEMVVELGQALNPASKGEESEC